MHTISDLDPLARLEPQSTLAGYKGKDHTHTHTHTHTHFSIITAAEAPLLSVRRTKERGGEGRTLLMGRLRKALSRSNMQTQTHTSTLTPNSVSACGPT